MSESSSSPTTLMEASTPLPDGNATEEAPTRSVDPVRQDSLPLDDDSKLQAIPTTHKDVELTIRRTNQQADDTNNTTSSQGKIILRQEECHVAPKTDDSLLMYALRPSCEWIQQPIMFFGFKDFKNFIESYAASKHVVPTTTTSVLKYRVFDDFQQAHDYVNNNNNNDAHRIVEAASTDQKKPPPQQESQLQQQPQNAATAQQEEQPSLSATNTTKPQKTQTAPEQTADHQQNTAMTTRRRTRSQTYKQQPCGETPGKQQQQRPAKRAGVKRKLPNRAAKTGKDATSINGDEKEETNHDRKAPKRQRLQKKGTTDEERWNAKFELLQQYKAEFGHCNVPMSRSKELPAKYAPLRSWVAVQRSRLKTDQLDSTTIATTASSVSSSRIPPTKIPLTPSQRQRLLNLDFVKDKRSRQQEEWNKKFDLLHEFKAEFGDCDVTKRVTNETLPPKYQPLKYWVVSLGVKLRAYEKDPSKANSRHKANNALTKDQRQRLLDLGFFTEFAGKHRQQWERNFELLKEYKAEFGSCNVPTTRPNPELDKTKYFPLIYWIQKQRVNFKLYEKDPAKSPMSAERRQRLLDLGFETNYTRIRVENGKNMYNRTFQKNLEKLKAYREKHGNVDVPKSSKLYHWLWLQRHNYESMQSGEETHLTLEKIGALASLGFSMTTTEVRPKAMKHRVQEYVDFCQKHGRHPMWNAKDEEEFRLSRTAGKWRQKRNLMSKGIESTPNLGSCKISQDLIDMLDQVNFRWQINEKIYNPEVPKQVLGWEARFEILKEFQQEHGHCEPPKRHPTLGLFVKDQRRHYRFMVDGRKSRMTMERFRKLSEIGFQFQPTPLKRGKRRERSAAGDNDSSSGDHHANSTGRQGGNVTAVYDTSNDDGQEPMAPPRQQQHHQPQQQGHYQLQMQPPEMKNVANNNAQCGDDILDLLADATRRVAGASENSSARPPQQGFSI